MLVLLMHRKGGMTVTNRKLLEQVIQDSGLKKGHIAEHLGISRGGLSNLLSGRSEFRQSQMQKLCELLQLSEEQRTAIFFAVDGA